jgi:hypothetical protein
MQLMMYLGTNLIESMEVPITRSPKPDYLGRFKRILNHKHSETIQKMGMEPQYLVVNVKTVSQPSNASYQLQF